jgi:hypothetical protein
VVTSSSLGQNSIIQLWHLKGSLKLSSVYLIIFAIITHALAGSGNRFMPTQDRSSPTDLEVILSYLYCHCCQCSPCGPPFSIYIIPYLIKAKNLPNNMSLNLYMKLMVIFSPSSISTPFFLPQDVQYPRCTIVYL